MSDRVVATNGDDWWRRLAANGVDGWGQEGTDMASPFGVASGRLVAPPILGTEW